ncbi:S-adenosylmethionine:tRNA ribosyltransferase-isomerase [Streptomyces sp. NPDC045714]|uniref:S-adenosylmethionine:tRNA ribosyltransferase-isomerase n=1 Tax=Streptomyces sp. NPDC045714 TaxID=3154913 RepID=UPI0033D10695
MCRTARSTHSTCRRSYLPLYALARPAYSPYLKQAPAGPEYYQNTYASVPGAVGNPAAGRHFTPALLKQVRERGVAVAEVTLFLFCARFSGPPSAQPLGSRESFPRVSRFASLAQKACRGDRAR